MSNLPITASAPQTSAAAPQSANAVDSSDAQNGQPFGDVLARQISDPAAQDAKTDDKLGLAALALIGTDAPDTKKDASDTLVAATPDGLSALPNEMLAALLPQALKQTATPADATATAVSDQPGITGATQDKRGIPTLKATPLGKPGIELKMTPGMNLKAAVQEQPFEGLFADAGKHAVGSMDLGAATHDTLPLQAAATQPSAAALASLQNTAAVAIAAPFIPPAQMKIDTPVTQDRWGDEFSQKITWLASSNQDQTAELHLNPPQLGPLDVVLKVSGDQATALFTSPHAAVREAIEQAMPKLRDMLADSGIMLGNATVSDHAPRDQGQSHAQRSSAPSGSDIHGISATANSSVRVSPISRHNGIVDTFA